MIILVHNVSVCLISKVILYLQIWEKKHILFIWYKYMRKWNVFDRMTLRKSLIHSCLFREEDGVQGLKVKGQYKLWDKERRDQRRRKRWWILVIRVKLSFFPSLGFGYLVLWWHPQSCSRMPHSTIRGCLLKCTKEMLSCDFARWKRCYHVILPICVLPFLLVKIWNLLYKYVHKILCFMYDIKTFKIKFKIWC